MKNQIVMSKHNGQLAVAIPLFRMIEDDVLDKIDNYVMAFKAEKPLAYVIDCGHVAQVISAEFAEQNLEFLGGL